MNCNDGYELYSERQKRLRGEVPDVYQYEFIPEKLRTQIVYIWCHVWGKVNTDIIGGTSGSSLGMQAFRLIHEELCEEYGRLRLNEPDRNRATRFHQAVQDFFIDVADTDEAIDVIEVSFRYIDQVLRDQLGFVDDLRKHMYGISLSPDEAIDQLNKRFHQHRVGYQYVSGEIIKVDSEVIHSEVVKPALGFLSDPIYEGANEEFLEAHKHYRNGDYKECLNNCLKAFESCLKTICRQREWHYDDKNAPAKKLIQIVLDKKLIPPFMESHFTGFRCALESGLLTLRNRRGAHGQGPEKVPVPDYMAAYALHLTASNILLLVRADENLETQ